ncbi:MAG: hypothetical protein ACOCY7_04940 [Halodesulfurarchaeum sp.]
MLADLTLTCSQCEDPLGETDRRLTMHTPEGIRHAYECSCGATTITLSRR